MTQVLVCRANSACSLKQISEQGGQIKGWFRNIPREPVSTHPPEAKVRAQHDKDSHPPPQRPHHMAQRQQTNPRRSSAYP